jgi:polyhydroxyalkanoate synthase
VSGETTSDKEEGDVPNDVFSRSADPLGFAKELYELVKQAHRFTLPFPFSSEEGPYDSVQNFAFNPLEIYRSLAEVAQQVVQNPEPFYEATTEYVEGLSKLWQEGTEGASLGHNIHESIINPKPGDRRFKDLDWDKNLYFNFIKQSYLLWDQWLMKIGESVQGIDKDSIRKVNFYLRQLRDAWAPTNFFWMNPTTLRKTLETKGSNIFQGMENFLKDMEKGRGYLDIQVVDPQSFKVGENIATTKGKVIYQNELMQLIQYQPTTQEVFKRPLFIIPPCINKFYVFDLRKENSLVRWCVDQGYTVFIISWVNPDERLTHKTFEEYVLEGLLKATEIIQKITQSHTIHAVGFCIGGNFLAALSGYLATRKEKNPLKTTTYLATLFDFQDSGDLRVFIDDRQLKELEKQILQKGYLEGRLLARTFNLLRANDLIWSSIIHNYYLGETPSTLDFLYWNADTTNLPSAMYLYYLRKMYIENLLIKPDGLDIDGQKIDLRKIKVPTFIFNTKEDHIAPWRCGYAGARVHTSPTKFVLGGSGHIAGVFNPPRSKKYGYWINEDLSSSPDDWFKKAEERLGSWWQYWEEWVRSYGDDKVQARSPGTQEFPPLEEAPGTYVQRDKESARRSE